ncbi:MAG TPA: hypothetical protein VID48_11285 [Solirubrobacteraceae bacterium]
MRKRARLIVLALAVCACLIGAALAFASETFTITSYFTPDKLGAPANLSAKTVFALNDGSVPTPVGHVLAYGPAGLRVDVAGTGTCQKAALELKGPSGCPADSRIGFGGGLGLVEIAKEFIKEPYTLDFFLAPKENGRLTVLIYAQGVSPVAVELVVVAKEIRGTKPYGFGVEFDIPPIPTLPGASYASIETNYFTVGSQHVAYYRTIHGKRQLVHVKGLIVPKTCPKGGFPFKVMISFLDGSSSTDTYTAPCPHK